MDWLFRTLRQFAAGVRGSASIEHGMVVATAVVIATATVAGLGSAANNSSGESASAVGSAVQSSSATLSLDGPVTLNSQSVTSAVYVIKDDHLTDASSLTPLYAVNTITFEVKNESEGNFDLGSLMVTYSDGTQRVELNNPSSGFTLDSTGKIVTLGNVTFNYIAGFPMGSGSAGETAVTNSPPSIKNGDLVEVTVTLGGTVLTNPLTTNSNFTLDFETQGAVPLNLEAKTPGELHDSDNT